MKTWKLYVLLLALMVCSIAADAQTTPNIGLNIPAHGTLNWDVLMNQNFSTLDLLLSGHQPLPAVTTGVLTLTNPGVFTSGQMNEYLVSNINGCNPTSILHTIQGATVYATEAMTGCLNVPAGTTVAFTNAISAYTQNNAAGPVPTAGGVSGQCLAATNSAYCVGGGFASGDTPGSFTGLWMTGLNAGVVASNNATSYASLVGLSVASDFLGTGPYAADGVQLTSAQTTNWANAIHSLDGAAAQGAEFGATGKTGTHASQAVTFNAINGGVDTGFAGIFEDITGAMTVFTPNVFRIKDGPHPFSYYPACSSSFEGAVAPITDSTTVTWGATITGGSSHHVMGYCDGSNWTVAAI